MTTERMSTYALGFEKIDKTMLAMVGGKGANLGELSKIKGLHVPNGFCITTKAFDAIISLASIDRLIEQLSEGRDNIREISSNIRQVIEGIDIPKDIASEILSKIDGNIYYAVRSSATAEDLPTASFAGQQDSYLNIKGSESILKHVGKCWASLFTERAVVYRIQNGFEHRKVQLSVVVQEMVNPQVSGILFTADPVTGNRKVSSIDASAGLGETLVSGHVNADTYHVIDGKIDVVRGNAFSRNTRKSRKRSISTLTDKQIIRLEQIGRKIEKHFGAPQDIEWCLANDTFYIVQSRPITNLYPIPNADDNENRVYVSVGHQQMMTDAMRPLGLSFFLLTTPASMRTAGGRLFVDLTSILISPVNRPMFLNALGQSDPLIRDALTTILERGDFIKTQGDGNQSEDTTQPIRDFQTLKDYDTSIVSELISREERSIEELKQSIKAKSGPALFDFILEDIQRSKKDRADPNSFGVIMTGMNAATWINSKMKDWLGETSVADVIAQSVPDNVTSEMGLALLDVADVIRPYPQVIEYLQHVNDNNFFDDLLMLNGGKETREAINTFLNKYGMRCAGEIDITRTRWSEKPTTLLPLILSNIKNFEPGAGARKFEQGSQQASKKEQEILQRLLQLPEGEKKARETKRMIDLVRNLAGYREYPKYAIVRRYFIYKQAIMKEAERLVETHVIHSKDDIYYLTFEELHNVVQTHSLDYDLVNHRKDDYKHFEKLTPPRVITSNGEILNGSYKRKDFPEGAIAGLAVSSGVVEGHARVILRMEDAKIEEGDILVTTFTDPSWTPLFVSIKGLVTEVGGLMTHGAVIAREYGLPAVVGVANATRLIRDGQRIRVNGTEGWIEILPLG